MSSKASIDLFDIASSSLSLSLTNLSLARESESRDDRELRSLLTHKRMLPDPLPDSRITRIIHRLSSFDSNNRSSNIGAGEREGRMFSSLVAARHYNLSHGIGRSGDLTAEQPKATGSSIIYRLTNSMTHHACKIAGLKSIRQLIVSAVPTGQSLALALIACRQQIINQSIDQSNKPDPRYVLMPRIDQKTCVKCASSAGFESVIVANKLVGDSVVTDIEALEQQVIRVGVRNIVAIISVTSCFAPRSCDDVIGIARLCLTYGIPHIVNNAYGIQSPLISTQLNSACQQGRVDCMIASCDKNFMVPVGGAIIATFDSKSSFDNGFMATISHAWSGRASISNVMDMFMTLLAMGESTYKDLLAQRSLNYATLKSLLNDMCLNQPGCRVLDISNNDIGLAIALPEASKDQITMLGSMLFTRSVSGCRAVHTSTTFAPHCDNYHCNYLACACAIGMSIDECSQLVKKLDQILKQWQKRINEQPQ